MLSVMERIRTYLQEVLKELQKVSWPTREQLIESTIVVTVAILLVSFLTFAADSVISLILENFYKFFS
ncbi:MAG TPA: preprotein translocase subunit SecE [Bacteroidetes bacterium]|nr:preprotein translocase subunit SecE [Bacteroidota bacterium]